MVESYEAAFATAQRLKAQPILVIGNDPDDLRTLDPAWLSYCQICDARPA